MRNLVSFFSQCLFYIRGILFSAFLVFEIHSKTMNIFEYNYLGCNKFNKLNIRFYQLISLIVRISLSGHGKALTRRTSSN